MPSTLITLSEVCTYFVNNENSTLTINAIVEKDIKEYERKTLNYFKATCLPLAKAKTTLNKLPEAEQSGPYLLRRFSLPNIGHGLVNSHSLGCNNNSLKGNGLRAVMTVDSNYNESQAHQIPPQTKATTSSSGTLMMTRGISHKHEVKTLSTEGTNQPLDDTLPQLDERYVAGSKTNPTSTKKRGHINLPEIDNGIKLHRSLTMPVSNSLTGDDFLTIRASKLSSKPDKPLQLKMSIEYKMQSRQRAQEIASNKKGKGRSKSACPVTEREKRLLKRSYTIIKPKKSTKRRKKNRQSETRCLTTAASTEMIR